jgi:serine protease Do
MKRKRLLFVPILLLLVFACACSNPPSQVATPTPTIAPTPSPSIDSGNSNSTPLPSIADVVDKIRPAVVYISVEYLDSSFITTTRRTKSGSGVLLSPDGYILTNNHVVEDAEAIDVLVQDFDRAFDAEIVGTDPLSDLAVIKIEGEGLPSAEFGDASRLRVGDWVVALGNALGSYLGPEGGPSVTVGIVSNLERSFSLEGSALYDIIQTDAAINPGNSGGPLVDLEGRVVGINTFIITAAQNIGFAVSASTAQRVYDDLVATGRVARPYVGVTLQTLTPDLASELGIGISRGVLVTFVAPDSPADGAGLEGDDVITHIQGQEVTEASRLIKLLWQYDVGDTVKLTYQRGAEAEEVWITLAERPESS